MKYRAWMVFGVRVAVCEWTVLKANVNIIAKERHLSGRECMVEYRFVVGKVGFELLFVQSQYSGR